MQRLFDVYVHRANKRPIKYPPAYGNDALRNMRTLAKRGLDVTAATTANGITEILTLDEMSRIYPI